MKDNLYFTHYPFPYPIEVFVLTQEEEKKVIQQSYQHPLGFLIRFLMSTGMKAEELLFHKMLFTLPETKRDLTNGVADYTCYLESVGYKLAHYFGFILADAFLVHVIPGYVSDTCTTIRYTMGLEQYLQLEIDILKE